MAKSMMARAIRGGVKVDFLLADVWFGTKAMLRSTEATVLAPYPNWSDSVGHPEFCTDKVVLKSSAIFFSRSVCTDLLNPGPEQLLYYFPYVRPVSHGTASFKLGI
jgi:hypothetical protein